MFPSEPIHREKEQGMAECIPMQKHYRFVRLLLQPVAKIYFRLRVTGEENLPRQGGLLLAANHCSYLDPPLIGVGLSRQICYLAKEELFRIPLFGLLLRWFGTYSVNRKQGDIRAVRTMLRLLQEDKALLIFPEGTRSENGRLLPLEEGLAWLSLRSGVPIVPLYVSGSWRALPRGRWFPRPHPVNVIIGKTIFPESAGEDPSQKSNIERLTAQVTQALLALRNQIEPLEDEAGLKNPIGKP